MAGGKGGGGGFFEGCLSPPAPLSRWERGEQSVRLEIGNGSARNCQNNSHSPIGRGGSLKTPLPAGEGFGERQFQKQDSKISLFLNMDKLPTKIWVRPAASASAVQRPKELRKEQTHAEKILWEHLRARRFEDTKFRRQHPIGKYVIDFFCYEAKLAIELDGSVHRGREEEDRWREQVIGTHGIKFLRFNNDEVEQDLPRVLERIREALPQKSLP